MQIISFALSLILIQMDRVFPQFVMFCSFHGYGTCFLTDCEKVHTHRLPSPTHLFHLGTQIVIIFSKQFMEIFSKIRRTGRMTPLWRGKLFSPVSFPTVRSGGSRKGPDSFLKITCGAACPEIRELFDLDHLKSAAQAWIIFNRPPPGPSLPMSQPFNMERIAMICNQEQVPAGVVLSCNSDYQEIM
jgi:hypothetical protein